MQNELTADDWAPDQWQGQEGGRPHHQRQLRRRPDRAHGGRLRAQAVGEELGPPWPRWQVRVMCLSPDWLAPPSWQLIINGNWSLCLKVWASISAPYAPKSLVHWAHPSWGKPALARWLKRLRNAQALHALGNTNRRESCSTASSQPEHTCQAHASCCCSSCWWMLTRH